MQSTNKKSILIYDNGFKQNTEIFEFLEYQEAPDSYPYVQVDATAYTNKINLKDRKIIKVVFPDFLDGRGFTLAKIFRLRGYKHHLRASGYVISDQYTMLRRVGFDDVEISDQMAKRQGETEWMFRSNYKAFDFQSRLRQRV